MRCIAASAAMACGFYPAMPVYVLHLHSRTRMRSRSKPICSGLPAPWRATASSQQAGVFPFNQRWGMMFWSALFNPDMRFRTRTP